MTKQDEVKQLRVELNATKRTLWTLIAWMAQSANSPIRIDEAQALSKMLDAEPTP